MRAQEIIGLLLSITAICSYINYKFVKLPNAIGLTLVALSITVIVNITDLFGWPIENMAQNLVDGIGFDETFLHGMLSFLLFAGALHINSLQLSKHKFMVSIYATVSVVISTIIIGYFTYAITRLLGVELPFYYCFVFGALISPTDAITVIEVLKGAKIPKATELKIAGEALFNDGMGIVLYFIFLGLAIGEKKNLGIEEVIFYLIREGVGGLVAGAVTGWIAVKILKTIDEHEQAIIFTLALVTGGYALATSVLQVSGPIFMVVTGLIVGSSYRRNIADFWDLLDQLLNAILFVLIGLEFVRIDYSLPLVLASIALIVATIIARWISIFIPAALCSKIDRLNTKMVHIMTWGGLRGGISIALALSISGKHHDIIVSITYFVVLFSIMIQGLTMKRFVNAYSNS